MPASGLGNDRTPRTPGSTVTNAGTLALTTLTSATNLLNHAQLSLKLKCTPSKNDKGNKNEIRNNKLMKDLTANDKRNKKHNMEGGHGRDAEEKQRR